MTRPFPPDLPDEPRPSIGESYRLYPAERPTEGEIWGRLLLVLVAAALLVGGLLTWGLAG